MKCLSLLQPWATLVIVGAKRFETRSWQTGYRGPLAIHASRRFPEWARPLCLQEPFRSALLKAGYRQAADLPTGAILGTVQLLDCLTLREVAPLVGDDATELAFGDYQPGRWAWRLADPRPFLRPMSAIGRLGVYEVSLGGQTSVANATDV